jgi:hypothetical protein
VFPVLQKIFDLKPRLEQANSAGRSVAKPDDYKPRKPTMTKTIKLLAVFSALAAGTAALAQQTAPAPAAGLLGQRYVGASFGYADIKNSPVDAFGADVVANFPVRANLDVGFGYSRTWVESFSDINVDAIGANATFIHTEGTLKTFTSLGLGYAWGPGEDEATVWGASAGAEFALTPKSTLAVSAGYSDDFKSGNNGVWDGTARANYWVTDKVAVVGTVSWLEGGDVAYTLGTVFRF